MALALDFASMMKAERARARGGPVEAPCKAAAPAPSQTALDSAALDFRLPSTARPRLGDAHQVAAAPRTVWHMPDWVTSSEEVDMVRCADNSPAGLWTALRGRRLQNLGGLPRPPPEGMVPEPLPGWVQSVCDALVAAGVFPADAPPNHVLLNEYQPGQGIDAHRDGPLYEPRVAIVSLGSACTFQFVSNDAARAPRASLLLPPRGVLVFADEAYEELLHTVPAVARDDAGQPNLIRLDVAPPVAAPPAPAGHGGPDTFVLAVDARARDAASTASAAPAVAACPPPPLPPRTRRVSLTVRRVLNVQPPESTERLEGRPWERRSPQEEGAALSRWLGERNSVAHGWHDRL